MLFFIIKLFIVEGVVMKNKINVDVLVPNINETYNMFIPVNKTVGEVVKLINLVINDLTEGEYPIKTNLSLIDLYTCTLYNFDYTVKNNKIKNGSKLVLI